MDWLRNLLTRIAPPTVTPVDRCSTNNSRAETTNDLEAIWFVLEKGMRKQGPFTVAQLHDRYGSTSGAKGLKIRKGDKGEWYPWVNAGIVYPDLLSAGLLPKPPKHAAADIASLHRPQITKPPKHTAADVASLHRSQTTSSLSAPVQKVLDRQRKVTKECILILTKCRSVEDVFKGLKKTGELLIQSDDPLAQAVLKASISARTLPDEYVLRLRDDFLNQLQSFLSVTDKYGH